MVKVYELSTFRSHTFRVHSHFHSFIKPAWKLKNSKLRTIAPTTECPTNALITTTSKYLRLSQTIIRDVHRFRIKSTKFLQFEATKGAFIYSNRATGIEANQQIKLILFTHPKSASKFHKQQTHNMLWLEKSTSIALSHLFRRFLLSLFSLYVTQWNDFYGSGSVHSHGIRFAIVVENKNIALLFDISIITHWNLVRSASYTVRVPLISLLYPMEMWNIPYKELGRMQQFSISWTVPKNCTKIAFTQHGGNYNGKSYFVDVISYGRLLSLEIAIHGMIVWKHTGNIHVHNTNSRTLKGWKFPQKW